jgi:hypothetical protein
MTGFESFSIGFEDFTMAEICAQNETRYQSWFQNMVGKTENEPIYSQVEGRINHNDVIIFGHVVLTTG